MITAEMIAAHQRYLTAAGYAATTIRDAGELLARVDADLPYGLPTATHEEIVDWLAQRYDPHAEERPWSRQTRKTYRDHIARFGAWAADPVDPWIDRDPAAALPRLRVPARLPRPAKHEHTRAACLLTDMPWRLCCRLAAYAGLRPCEIARLRREDVDRNWLIILGKGDRSRRVPTHPVIWSTVEHLPPGAPIRLGNGRLVSGPLVRRPNGEPATGDWVSKSAGLALRKLYGLPISLYRLRHWYGTYVQAGQGDDRVTQELMGHASPVTTAGYTAVSDARLRAAIESLPTWTETET